MNWAAVKKAAHLQLHGEKRIEGEMYNHNIFSSTFRFAVAAYEFVIKHKKLASHIALFSSFLYSFLDALEKTKHIWLKAKKNIRRGKATRNIFIYEFLIWLLFEGG